MARNSNWANIPHYSPSQLSLYLSNPAKYKHKYIDKIKTDGYTHKSLHMGTAVHKALLEYWLQGDRTISKKKVVNYAARYYGQITEKDPNAKPVNDDDLKKVRLGTAKGYDSYKKTGLPKGTEVELVFTLQQALNKYLDRDFPEDTPIICYVDSYFEKIDELSFNGEEELIVDDLKTTGRFKSGYSSNKVFTSLQLRMYAMALEINHNMRVNKVRFRVIDWGSKIPKVNLVEFNLEKDWQRKLTQDIFMAIRGIKSEIFPRSFDDENAHWNDYKHLDWDTINFGNEVKYEVLA